MAWQSGPGAGGGGGAMSQGETVGVQAYTLQGRRPLHVFGTVFDLEYRCHAIPTNRMAST